MNIKKMGMWEEEEEVYGECGPQKMGGRRKRKRKEKDRQTAVVIPKD